MNRGYMKKEIVIVFKPLRTTVLLLLIFLIGSCAETESTPTFVYSPSILLATDSPEVHQSPTSTTSSAQPLPTPTFPSSLAVISADTADQIVLLQILSGHDDRVNSLAFSGDGKYFASSSLDGTIKLWDVQNMQEVHSFQKQVNKSIVNDIAFSPDGQLLANANLIWDVESKQTVHTIEPEGMAAVDFSPDGSTLAVGLVLQSVKLWDVTSGDVLMEFDEGTDKFNIAFSPDGHLLAAGGLHGLVRLWDVKSGQISSIFEYGDETGIHDLAFSPDGKILASGGTDSWVRFWDIASGQMIWKGKLIDGLFGLAFSPDGTVLASAGGRGGVSLFEEESGVKIRSLPHQTELMDVVFSPKGTLLIAAGYDHQIYVWGIEN